LSLDLVENANPDQEDFHEFVQTVRDTGFTCDLVDTQLLETLSTLDSQHGSITHVYMKNATGVQFVFVLADYCGDLEFHRLDHVDVVVRIKRNAVTNLILDKAHGATTQRWLWDVPTTYIVNPRYTAPSRFHLMTFVSAAVASALGISVDDCIPQLDLATSTAWMSGISPFDVGEVVQVVGCTPIAYEFKRLSIRKPVEDT